MVRLSLNEFIEILAKLLAKATTEKQRCILTLLSKEEFRFYTTTKAVKIIAAELCCAESTVWDSVSVLKEFGFVICNGRIELTQAGKMCAKVIK